MAKNKMRGMKSLGQSAISFAVAAMAGIKPPYQKQPGAGQRRASKRLLENRREKLGRFGSDFAPIIGFGERQRRRAEERLLLKSLGQTLQANERRTANKEVGYKIYQYNQKEVGYKIYRYNQKEYARALQNG